MPVEGDSSGLRELQRQMREMGSWARSSMAPELGMRGLELIQVSFETGTDTDGRPWLLTAEGKKPLSNTGSFQGSFSMLPSGQGFVIESSKFWAGVHNEGAKISAKPGGALRFQIGGRWVMARSVTIPERRFVPGENTTDARWSKSFERLVDLKMTSIFGKKSQEMSFLDGINDMLSGVL